MKFLIYLIILLVGVWIIEYLLRKSLNIKREGYIYKPINQLHKRLEWTLLGLFFISIILFSKYTFIIVLLYLFILNLFRGFMEWLFARDKREYIITLLFIIIYPLYVLIIYFLCVSFGFIPPFHWN
ncbi:DUF4181 domain-containing protein [Rummeliibacillus stabekisii]|uniref:DUF4181 domain-containing protein n=1 Tax=Rummeliibacillus stabekisii TaxID=241244 RepID=UPI003D8194AA